MSKSLFTEANDRLVEAIVSARHQAGLRQVDLAQKLGKDQSFISNIERGQRRVDVLEFYMLAQAIGSDPVELFASAVSRFPDNFDI
ncbi:MAG: helix-turn-helix transcriptional regulator [Pseudomonadota bacterium]